MTTLPPHLESLGADVSRAAERRVRELRRRRRAAQIGTVALSALVLTGAGLAASGVGIFGWLAGGDETEARFSVSATERYDGPAPPMLGCRDVAALRFSCTDRVGGADRTYRLLLETSPPPFASRDDLLDKIAAAERAGTIDAAVAATVRRQVDAVSDDFFSRLTLLSQFQSVSAGVGDGRGELLPPEGVPGFAVCVKAVAGRLTCLDLRGATEVPVGAPIYRLEVTPDWRVRTGDVTPADDPNGYNQVFLEVFGRPLTPQEQELLTTISTPTTVETQNGTTIQDEQAADSTSR